MTAVPDRSTFENIYAGQPSWEIGRPQKALIDVADQIIGSILDAGCGTGENALFFASGLFHVFHDDDRRRYVEGLATVLKSGGRLFLLCFSDEEPGTQGPRRVSKKELHNAFAEGWKVESIEPSRYEVRPDLKDLSFSEGGPKAWFVVVSRK